VRRMSGALLRAPPATARSPGGDRSLPSRELRGIIDCRLPVGPERGPAVRSVASARPPLTEGCRNRSSGANLRDIADQDAAARVKVPQGWANPVRLIVRCGISASVDRQRAFLGGYEERGRASPSTGRHGW
jgi:hypothetical protein